MIGRIAAVRTSPLPIVLRYTDIRSYILSAIFVALSVFVPRVFHQFHLAGATFLPMHLFVLAGGLLFGWRAGLVVGMVTPLASYAVSGMPALQLLPQVTVELAAYGVISGLLRERFNVRAIWSLLGAMAGGRLALVIASTAIYLLLGTSYSPLGAETSPLTAVWATVKQGWPGILVQLAFVPVLVKLAGHFTGRPR